VRGRQWPRTRGCRVPVAVCLPDCLTYLDVKRLLPLLIPFLRKLLAARLVLLLDCRGDNHGWMGEAAAEPGLSAGRLRSQGAQESSDCDVRSWS
jgi:hypothetical protein